MPSTARRASRGDPGSWGTPRSRSISARRRPRSSRLANPTLPVDDLPDHAFAPFGTVVRRPSRPHDATGPGWQWWAETVVLQDDGRPWSVGDLDLEPAAPRFDWAERPLRSQEAIVPVSGRCLVYVAPADNPDEPDRLPPFDAFRVFRVPPGSGVVMNPAVW